MNENENVNVTELAEQSAVADAAPEREEICARETEGLPAEAVTPAEDITAPVEDIAETAEPLPPTEEEIRDGEKARVGKIASRTGLFVTVLYLAWTVLATATSAILSPIASLFVSAFGWSASDVSAFTTLFANAAAMFAAAMIARPLLPKPAPSMPKGKFGFGRVLCALGATVVFVMIMAPLGQSFTYMWNTLTGCGFRSESPSNPLAMLLFAGILTPIVEELIFRRFLLGRLRPLGEGFAILLSSAIFAVFHMNFTQIFFTFFCGLVWGYVYCRSGRFWHVCFLHIAYNTLYGLLLPYLTEWSMTAMEQISSVGGKLTPEDILPYIGNLLIVMAWGLLLAVITALAVLGVIALSRTLPRLKVDGGEFSLTRKEKLRAVFTASGFIAMLLVGAIFLVSHVTRTPVLSMLLPR